MTEVNRGPEYRSEQAYQGVVEVLASRVDSSDVHVALEDIGPLNRCK